MERENAIFCHVTDMLLENVKTEIGNKIWFPLYIQVSCQKEGEIAAKEVKANIERGVEAQKLLYGIESYIRKE